MLRLSVAGIVTLLQVCRVTTESFAVSVPTAPLVTRLGDDLTVPCHLSPAVSAVAMEVRWARESGRDPVHVYRQHQHTQGRNFSGRTTLSRAGLEKGDVSLLIRDLRVADQGRYTCFVDSGSFYDRAEVEVKISMTGSAPLVSLDGHQSGGIALSCESEGWYPQPDVQWKTKPRTTLSAAPRSHITRTPDGLYSVRSDLLLPGRAGGAVSCVVTHGGDRTQVQSRVYISDEFFMPGMTLLISLILFFSIFVIIIITFLIFYCRLRKDNLKTKDDILKLNNVLGAQKEIEEARKYKETITLDPKTSHPKLRISEDRKRVCFDKNQNGIKDNNKRYKYWSGVLGEQGFSSGKHYWEVKVDGLDHWDLGVALESVNKDLIGDIQHQDGYWSIWFVYNEYWALDITRPSIQTIGTLHTVGVYLDYDAGLVSFYDVINKLRLYTFHSEFKERLYPFFNPWGCKNELVILSEEEIQDRSDNTTDITQGLLE